jgi:hypothetical protein
MVTMIVFWAVTIFLVGFAAGGGCSGGDGGKAPSPDSDGEHFERPASHGERRDAR